MDGGGSGGRGLDKGEGGDSGGGRRGAIEGGASEGGGQNGLSRSQSQIATIRGNLTVDTDGGATIDKYGDPHHQNITSGVLNGEGKIIPSGHGGRPLNANLTKYVVAPSTLRTTNGGILRPGDWAAVMNLRNGRLEYMQIGDFSHKSRVIEVSIAGARGLGADIIRGKDGPVATMDGRIASPIPAEVTFYAGSGPQ